MFRHRHKIIIEWFTICLNALANNAFITFHVNFTFCFASENRRIVWTRTDVDYVEKIT
jgi:hypothetical protein